MDEAVASVKAGPGAWPWGCLVFVVLGLLLLVFGRPSEATMPWFYLVWGGLLLRPLAFRVRSNWFWGESIDRRSDPYRYWLTMAAAVIMIGLSLYGLVAR